MAKAFPFSEKENAVLLVSLQSENLEICVKESAVRKCVRSSFLFPDIHNMNTILLKEASKRNSSFSHKAMMSPPLLAFSLHCIGHSNQFPVINRNTTFLHKIKTEKCFLKCERMAFNFHFLSKFHCTKLAQFQLSTCPHIFIILPSSTYQYLFMVNGRWGEEIVLKEKLGENQKNFHFLLLQEWFFWALVSWIVNIS